MLRVRQHFRAERFDGSTSFSDFGTSLSSQNFASATERTVLMHIRCRGENAATGQQQWIGKASGGAGFRFGINPTSDTFYMGYTSTSVAFRPFKVSAVDTNLDTGEWYHLAGVYNGGLVAAGITLYSGRSGRPLANAGSSSSDDGIGTIQSNSADNFQIGRAVDGSFYANGELAYVAIWRAQLTLQQLLKAQQHGPLALGHDRLFFCWAEGRDHGPLSLPRLGRTNVRITQGSPYARTLGRGGRVPWADVIAAAAAPSLPLLGQACL